MNSEAQPESTGFFISTFRAQYQFFRKIKNKFNSQNNSYVFIYSISLTIIAFAILDMKCFSQSQYQYKFD